jgi:ParB-like chromosome segregation protein Spo0J
VTAAKAKAKVWSGSPVLRRMLVPIEGLEPFPGNPRRGDLEATRASLHRFGQLKPIVVDGSRIVAGHTTVRAAAEEGWTHVAAAPNEFGSDDEARAFLLADNRTSDLGSYDDAQLVAHLAALAEIDSLEGTGYAPDDLDDLYAQMARADADPDRDRPDRDPPPDGVSELVLLYSQAHREQLEQWIKVVQKEKGIDGVSEAIYEACRIAAEQLHG